MIEDGLTSSHLSRMSRHGQQLPLLVLSVEVMARSARAVSMMVRRIVAVMMELEFLVWLTAVVVSGSWSLVWSLR